MAAARTGTLALINLGGGSVVEVAGERLARHHDREDLSGVRPEMLAGSEQDVALVTAVVVAQGGRHDRPLISQIGAAGRVGLARRTRGDARIVRQGRGQPGGRPNGVGDLFIGEHRLVHRMDQFVALARCARLFC